MNESLKRRREFEGAGQHSKSAIKEMAEELVRADRSKRMNFSPDAAKNSNCPGCGNTLGDFPYHMRDGRVLCNNCGVEEASRHRPIKQRSY
jgi:protein-arginine kinase activator protein McsA